MGLISVLIGVLVIVVVGAICFWAIDKFANDRRLANLLKLLVVLICLGAILQRVVRLTYCAASGVSWLREFDDPIPLPRGRQFVTFEDAARHIQKAIRGLGHSWP